jgi:outer membrane protein assembly factor BamA
MKWRLCLLLMLPASIEVSIAASLGEEPVVREIVFEGNDVTQTRTMLREISLRDGAPASEAALDDARQSILDLGLFRDVKVRTEPLDDGVRVIFKVVEKWYILPVPRVDANSDGRLGLGMALNWDNVWGLNHRVRALVSRTTYDEAEREAETLYRASYEWPLVADSPWGLSMGGAFARQSSVFEEVRYEELTRSVNIGLTRQLDESLPSSQGWLIGGSLGWSSQNTSGEDAPPSDGHVVILEGLSQYRRVRFNVYSETGRFLEVRGSANVPGLGDFGFQQITADYAQFWRVGQRAHQTAHFLASAGTYHGGPKFRRDVFSLGGSSTLRGYDNEFLEGDSFMLVAGEFLRPVFGDSTRLLLLAEMGAARRTNRDPIERPLYVSVGAGIRVRFTWFVRFELEVGVAYPLIDGDGLRFFAGGV